MISYILCTTVLILIGHLGISSSSPTGTSSSGGNTCTSSNPLSQNINDFGFQLSQKLEPDGNLFISPFSIYTALAMTHAGAKGQTATQIGNVLNFGSNGQDLKQSFKVLLDNYLNKNADYSLEVANGLFLEKDLSVKDEFVNDLKNFYHAVVQLLDFAGDGQGSMNAINGWVSENTHQKINKLLSEPLSSLTKLALLNAIYFKGTWKTRFNEDFSYDGTFYRSDNDQKKVRFMNLVKQKFPFFEDDRTGYKFLEMPYKGDDVVMLLALPQTAQPVPNLQMSSSKLCDIFNNLHNVTMDSVVLPKFSLEYQKQLKEVLIAMGIKDIFTSAADLTGISNEPDLLVSSVLHKAVIDVNEEGSEAAATTGVFITKLSLFPTLDFIADHPFLFYIVDKRNGLVLFSGRVTQP